MSSPDTIGRFLALDRPRVIAHRGFSGIAPENTIAAFQRAIDLGADMIELDVQLSRDGEPVVVHDDTLDRTTDGSGPVADRELAELRRLDAGGWFSPEFAGERIPTLREVLELARGRILVDVEVKDAAATEATVRAIEAAGTGGEVLISSFAGAALSVARQRNAEIVRAPLLDAARDAHRSAAEILREHDARALSCSMSEVTAAIARSCHDAGGLLFVYTVDEVDDMERALGLGADGLFTNRPDVMLELIRP